MLGLRVWGDDLNVVLFETTGCWRSRAGILCYVTLLSDHIMQVTDVLCFSVMTIKGLVHGWFDTRSFKSCIQTQASATLARSVLSKHIELEPAPEEWAMEEV